MEVGEGEFDEGTVVGRGELDAEVKDLEIRGEVVEGKDEGKVVLVCEMEDVDRGELGGRKGELKGEEGVRGRNRLDSSKATNVWESEEDLVEERRVHRTC